MIFQAHESWQVKNEFITVFDSPEVHRYNIIELGINVPIFITELVFRDDENDIKFRNTYLVSDFETALSLSSDESVLDHSISILLPRYEDDGKEFTAGTINEVYDAVMDNNKIAKRVYVLATGKRYVKDYNIESDLIELELIYRKPHM